MKIYVSDIGDSSVGIQELTIATLDLHESMIEVLEENKDMENFKKEFMALIDKYCEPEVSYDVYSDKDLEEEAKFEEEMMKEYCQVDVTATLEMYKNKPKFNSSLIEHTCPNCGSTNMTEDNYCCLDCGYSAEAESVHSMGR